MWCYRRFLRISWTEKKTNKSILDELQTRRELLAQIIKRKIAFFGHACRNTKCNLVKTCILGMMPGKRRRGGAQDTIHVCVFRPVLQRFGSDIAHILHVKAGGCGSSANQCTAHM